MQEAFWTCGAERLYLNQQIVDVDHLMYTLLEDS